MLKFEKKSIPNYLTIIRFIFVPIIFIFILKEKYILAAIFFILANVTDFLDGYIARKYNYISDWGKLMDPLADKTTQILTILALIIKGILPFWILVVLGTKELIMIIVAFVLYKKHVVTVHSKWYGKVATILFFITIAITLLSEVITSLSYITIYLYYISIGMALFAGIMYSKNIVCKEF